MLSSCLKFTSSIYHLQPRIRVRREHCGSNALLVYVLLNTDSLWNGCTGMDMMEHSWYERPYGCMLGEDMNEVLRPEALRNRRVQ